jgi:uncharacterized protein (DUF924 family)
LSSIDEVLAFWFSEDGRRRWFAPTPAFDRRIRERFAGLAARAAGGELETWEGSARGCVALCVLLDQMPRHMFRGTPRAFATDHKALDVAARAVDLGFDQELPPEQRQFLYLPFSHSERLADQLRAAALFEAVQLGEALAYVQDHHLAIIRRFGRFPHRNAILGRPSTPEELEFLARGGEDFGQTSSGSVTNDSTARGATARAGNQ